MIPASVIKRSQEIVDTRQARAKQVSDWTTRDVKEWLTKMNLS